MRTEKFKHKLKATLVSQNHPVRFTQAHAIRDDAGHPRAMRSQSGKGVSVLCMTDITEMVDSHDPKAIEQNVFEWEIPIDTHAKIYQILGMQFALGKRSRVPGATRSFNSKQTMSHLGSSVLCHPLSIEETQLVPSN
jgi:hypothetical protein